MRRLGLFYLNCGPALENRTKKEAAQRRPVYEQGNQRNLARRQRIKAPKAKSTLETLLVYTLETLKFG
jgi:hypothetical protein